MNNRTRNRFILLALFGMFFVPVFLAYLMNTGWIDYHPQPSKNHGNLINPPIKMKDYTDLPDLTQEDDKWKLVYVAQRHCNEDCTRMLDTLYRVFLATGRHQDKVELLVLSPDGGLKVPPAYEPAFTGVSLENQPRLASLLARLSEDSLGQGKGFYIVAPEGYLMMSYPKDFNPSGTIKDLNVLLKRKDG